MKKYNIESSYKFDIAFKRLSKKYKTLENELIELSKSLSLNPKQGSDLGGGLFKIRMASKSKDGGKSGGFRVITYYVEKTKKGETLYLVRIYDKSEFSSIDSKSLLKIVNAELE